jgi:hypothetical protein
MNGNAIEDTDLVRHFARPVRQARRADRIDDEKAAARHRRMIVAGLPEIGSKDALEEMVAAQMLACHDAAMECYEYAAANSEGLRREYLNQAGKLSRTFAMLLDALNRHRGKGQQRIVVEHVHVHPGGQAVVGVVEAPGGGVRSKSENQPNGSKTTAKASQRALRAVAQPSLRSKDAEGDTLSVSSDDERALPDAWRTIPGRSEGE